MKPCVRVHQVGGAWQRIYSTTKCHGSRNESVPCCGLEFLFYGLEFLMIRSLGSSLEYLRYSQEYLNHVTFAPLRGGRPDGAGWLARRVQTGRRVKLTGPMVRGWYEPRTFE